ncbi:PorP/SprF family type IX secretion system membrane protein [Gaetbulibacter saemankumensis]|uniref:PorP/SprF family type IX secretion system membrane protein n=1 Tax=Gaetbulibacter saemankumensis TaxID=311208 RepID=UPI0004172CC9|nr:PorP/SprF family type IX secretion system membrane protein [Gaetbulibacter saemankumensis]
MKLNFLHIAIFACLTQLLFAQDNAVVGLALPVRNSLKFNKHIYNPSFSFVREQNRYISFSNKRQWVQFDDAPQTYIFGYAGRFQENMGMGISLFQQNYGVLTTFGGLLNFAYNAQLNRDSNLTFGMNLGIYQSGLNNGKVHSNFPDPVLGDLPSNTIITINPGINYGTTFLDFGLAINNVAAYNFTSSKMLEDNPEQGIQAHIMYTGYMDSRGFFDEAKFTFLGRSEFQKDNTIISGLVMLQVPKGIWAQAGYNTLYGASAGLGLNITSQIAVEYNYEQAIGKYSNFGNSHEFTVAYKIKNRDRYNYSGDDQEEAFIISETKHKRTIAKRKPSYSAPIDRKKAIEERAKARAEAQALLKAKAAAKAEERAKLKAEAEARIAAKKEDILQPVNDENKVKETTISTENNITTSQSDSAAIAKAKAEEEARLKREAEQKAKAAEQARLAAIAKAKAEEETRLKREAEQKAKAAEQARLSAIAKAKAEEEARLKREAEQKAKAAEQARLAAIAKAKAEEEVRLKREAEQKAKAAEQARLAAIAKAKAEEEVRLKREAEQKAKAAEQARLAAIAKAKAEEEANKTIALPEATDETTDAMNTITQLAMESNAVQQELMARLQDRVDRKEKDLFDLKRENDLSEQGIYSEPKPFKSVSEENQAIASLKADIDNTLKNQEEKIQELENLYSTRIRKVRSKTDTVNMFYANTIEQLKSQQNETKQAKERLDSSLESINIATEVERKRRIKRAAYDDEQARYDKDMATLVRIKQNTPPSSKTFTASDFDHGESLGNNIKIVKDVKNTSSGYYLVIAVHSNVTKRDEFITKCVAAGQDDINFFFDVNTNKYYIYYEKFDNLNSANNALNTKGSKPYNVNMSMVKIEN